MPQSDWLTEKDKSTYIGNEALADFRHKMAKMQAEIQRGVDAHASKAAIRDANTKGQQKDAKEKQAAKKKSQSTDEPVTKNLPTNSVANVKGSSQQGSTQDLTTMLPPTGEAPPFLMDHSRQTSLGMEALDPVVSAPVRRTVDRTNVKPNVLTAAQQREAMIQRARTMIQQQQFQQEQQRLVETENRSQSELERANKVVESQNNRKINALETESRLSTVRSIAETFGASGAPITAKVLRGEVITAEDLAGKTTLAERKTLSQEKLATRELELREAADRRAEKLFGVQMIGGLKDLSNELKAQNRLDYKEFTSAQIMGWPKDQVGNPDERHSRVWSPGTGELTTTGKTYFSEEGKINEDADPLRFHMDVVVPFAQKGQIVVFDRSTDFVSRWGRGIFRKLPFKTTGEQDLTTVDERVYWATKSLADRGNKDALKQMEAWGHYKNAEGDVEDDGPLRTSAKALHQGYDKLVRGTDLEDEALRSIGASPSPFTDRQVDPRRREQQLENERALKALEDMEAGFQSRLFGDE